MSIEITIHGTGTGTCSLSGKECDGMTVSFRDGTITEAFLSQKSFMQILRMKTAKNGKPTNPPTEPKPIVAPTLPLAAAAK